MPLNEITPISEKVLYYEPSQGALGLSDVNLVPRHTDISSRYGDQIQTSTVIAKGMSPINIPILTAGMDRVTGAQMAITIALKGGIGEVHRNNTILEQSAIINEVKDRLRVMEDDPPRLPETATITDAKNLLEKRKRGYVIVYPGSQFDGTVSGIATPKDFLVKPSDSPLAEVMTARDKIDFVTQGNTLQQAVEFMKIKRREKVPVFGSDGKLVGMYSMKDSSLYSKNPFAALDGEGRLMVGAAIGAKVKDVERAHALEDAGADVIFVDIAHGDNENDRDIMNRLKNGPDRLRIPVILGNFSPFSDIPMDGENVVYALEVGADGIKIGVGPGKVCKSRDIAGTGVPQLTAVLNTQRIMDRLGIRIPIIADGGVRLPHDVEVSIAAGADAVMIGSVFAGTSDSPGEIIMVNGQQMKLNRGMASKVVFDEMAALGEKSTTDAAIYRAAAEGGEELFPYKGETKNVIYQYVGGLRSAMAYVNAHNIKELQDALLVKLTSSGANEHQRAIG